MREALPWWIFVIIGGLVSVVYLQTSVADYFHLPLGDAAVGADFPKWLPYVVFAVAFVPGAIVFGLAGWFLIRPVNWGLSIVFRGFNTVFDKITAAYGWTVGHSLADRALDAAVVRRIALRHVLVDGARADGIYS